MRAERLLSILLYLEGRRRAGAAELARETGVSLRTLYRDMEALAMAGVPLSAEPGPGGGYALMEGWRSGLSGLEADEAEALFAAFSGGPLTELGLDGARRRALAKVAAALPERHRRRRELAGRRILVEARPREPGDALKAAHDAVMGSQELELELTHPWSPVPGLRSRFLMRAYGLVWSDGRWWLCGEVAGALRAADLSRVAELRPTGRRFDPPDEFDLEAFWRTERERSLRDARAYRVRARLAPAAAAALSHRALPSGGGTAAQGGFVELDLGFSSLEEARGALAAWGAAAEVLEPAALRQSLADLARAVAGVYKEYA